LARGRIPYLPCALGRRRSDRHETGRARLAAVEWAVGTRGPQVVGDRPSDLPIEDQISGRLHGLGRVGCDPHVVGKLLQIYAATLQFGPPGRVWNRARS